jgi:DNA-binding NtrC family response regulator
MIQYFPWNEMRSEQLNPVSEVVPTVGWEEGVRLTRKILPRPSKRETIFWVDDCVPLLSLYRAVFESLGFEVRAASCAADALKHTELSTADIVILDYDMPDMNGAALASLIKNQCPSMPVILYSGSSSIPPAAHKWVDAICAKGAPREELLSTIDRLASGRRASGTGMPHPASPTPCLPQGVVLNVASSSDYYRAANRTAAND